MEKEYKNESLESLPRFNSSKFSVVSKIYGNRFGTVTLIVFNSETGELKKHVFENEKTELNTYYPYDGDDSCDCPEEEDNDDEEYVCEACEHEKEIRADTAENVQKEITELKYGYPVGAVQHIWNDAITEAANCCNGYDEVVGQGPSTF